MPAFAKKIYQNSYKTLGPEESHNSKWMKCTKVNFHYTSKIHKNNNLQHQKRSKLRSARELTVCEVHGEIHDRRQYKRFRSRKNEVCGTGCVRKAISKPTVIDTSQKLNRNKKLHIRTLQSATTYSWSASVPLEQSINTFSFSPKET